MSTFNTRITIEKNEGVIDNWQAIVTGEDLRKQVGDYLYSRVSDTEVVFLVNRSKPLEFYVPDCSTVAVETGEFHARCDCCEEE